jgi:predicted nucleotidyltransferase component of viral defense system
MNVDRTTLDRLAAETGFSPGALEKVIRLGDMLADVQRHPLLSRVLVLKGGTALNLCFGAPPRLSVDLDFNYVGAEGREAMLAERPDVERAVETLAAPTGWRWT